MKNQDPESAAAQAQRETAEAQARDETRVQNLDRNAPLTEGAVDETQTGTVEGGIDTGTAPASSEAGPGVLRADGSVAPAE